MSAADSSAGKMRASDPRLREDHRHRAAVQGERGRDLGADEAAADHEEARARVGERAQAPVVVDRAEVDDRVVAEGEPARAAAGREQQPLVARNARPRSSVASRASEVERDDPPAEPQIDAELGRPAPDRVLLASPFQSAFESGGRAYGG